MQLFHTLTDPKLAALLQSGAVGVMPTDTIYGLVCAAQNQQAVERLYALKSRERKPGTVMAAGVAQLERLGVRRQKVARVERFWPGPVSVVLQHDRSYLHQGIGNQPFRIPDNVVVRTLLEQTGPLLTTSANHPGETPATNLTEAETYFGEQVDFYVDGGTIAHGSPSTIIRLNEHNQIEVMRQGAYKIKQEKL